MKRVFFNEFNILMGDTTYLPLVSGLLQAFAETRVRITDNYDFQPFLFHVDRPESILDQYENPSVAAFSVCMWNEQLNLRIAREVKERWPECLIVFGGPQVPHNPTDYFAKHPFIDVSVRGEGEEPFSDVLERFLDSREFDGLPSVSWRHPETGACIHNAEEQPFNRDLDYYPSPYLEGLYENLIKDHPEINFQAIMETNRGCPFLCTFCYWVKGGLSRKYRYHGLDRVFGELEWCADHEIRYLFNADSNFGMHRRDREIAEKLVELKTTRGYPEKFRTCYGKNTDEKIFEIGALFHEHEIEKGITLSRQSLNENTLKIIKRDNIKLEVYSNLQRNFNELDVPVYCEMILGLPGETFDSWVEGIETLLQTGIKNQIFIYFCQIFNNTELADPKYREENGLITRDIVMQPIHTAISRDGWIDEYEETIVGTNTMSIKDWRRAARFSWITMLLHSMKAGFYIMGYIRDLHGLAYTDFVRFISDREADFNGTMIGDALDEADRMLDGILNSQGRGCYDKAYGEIYWEFEEMGFLRMSENMDRFYAEFEILCQDYLTSRDVTFRSEELHEAVVYQHLLMPRCTGSVAESAEFNFNFPEFFAERLGKDPVALKSEPQRLLVSQPDFDGDTERYAREVILWGRKSGLIERESRWEALNPSNALPAAE